jgi:hypothetical protein
MEATSENRPSTDLSHARPGEGMLAAATGIRAEPDVVPAALPLLAPGERAAARRAILRGQVGLLVSHGIYQAPNSSPCNRLCGPVLPALPPVAAVGFNGRTHEGPCPWLWRSRARPGLEAGPVAVGCDPVVRAGKRGHRAGGHPGWGARHQRRHPRGRSRRVAGVCAERAAGPDGRGAGQPAGAGRRGSVPGGGVHHLGAEPTRRAV